MRLVFSILLAMVSAAGCAAETGRAERALELGTGSWRFEALEDGQEVELVRGAQGGWHVWVSLRTNDVAMDRALLELEVQPADESRAPSITEVEVRFNPPDREGRRSLLGWPAIVEEPSCLVGEMIRIEARLEGEALDAERYVIPLGGTYPPPACE